ncbi:MAG: hypothetical protein ACO3JL_17810 [Myxococcota bacterium]
MKTRDTTLLSIAEAWMPDAWIIEEERRREREREEQDRPWLELPLPAPAGFEPTPAKPDQARGVVVIPL